MPFVRTQITLNAERRVHDALVSTRQLSKGLEGTIVLGTALVSFHLQYTPSPHIMISWKNTKPVKKMKTKNQSVLR